MKAIKARGLFIVLALMMILGLSACSKENDMTADEIVTAAYDNVQAAKSNTGDMLMEMDMTIAAEGMSLQMTMSMDMFIESYVGDPAIAHVKGNMKISAMGQEQTQEMEVYTSTENDLTKTFSSTDGVWTYSEDSDSSSAASMAQLGEAIFKTQGAWTLENAKVKINDKENYVLKTTIKGDQIGELMDLGEQMLDSLGDTGVDFSGMEIPVEIYVEPESLLPTKMVVDMSSVFTNLFEGTEAEGTEVSVFRIVMENLKYNTLDSLEIPENVLAYASKDVGNAGGAETTGYEAADDSDSANAAGKYVLANNNVTSKIQVVFPEGFTSYYAAPDGWLSLSQDDGNVEASLCLYDSEYHTLDDMKKSAISWADYIKEDPDNFQDIQISDIQTRQIGDKEVSYIVLSFMRGDYSYVEYYSGIVIGDAFLSIEITMETDPGAGILDTFYNNISSLSV